MGPHLSDEELDRLSALLNAFMGGAEGELLSVRAYRERYRGFWSFVLWRLIDNHFARRGDPCHCRRKWLEVQQRSHADEVDALINVGL